MENWKVSINFASLNKIFLEMAMSFISTKVRSRKRFTLDKRNTLLSGIGKDYNGQEEKFNIADFDQVMILISSYFNGSALDDVESQLITYFMADNPKSKQRLVQYDNDEIINRTYGNSVNDYREREKVASEVILPFWEKELYPNGWVSTKTLEELRNGALVKYSPIKELTNQQMGFLEEIESNPDKSFVINGDAGTGKTVLLTHLVAKLLKEKPNQRIAVVLRT